MMHRPGPRILVLPVVSVPIVCLAALVLMAVRTSVRLTAPPGYSHPGHEQRAAGTVSPTATPTWTLGDDPGQAHGLAFREVEFPTADGAILRGWLIPGQGGTGAGIVAAHARGGDRRGYLDLAPMFHRLGFSVLLFDYREHGISDGAGRGMSLGHGEAADISAAVRHLKQAEGLRRVGVIGHSLGGSSVILAAANDPTIDAVVAENSIASFDDYVRDMTDQWLQQRRVPSTGALWHGWWPRLVVAFTARRIGVSDLRAPVDVIGQIAPRPILLIHGTHDTVVYPEHSERLLASAGEPQDLWLVPGIDHSSRYPDYPPEYRQRISAFLAQALR